MLLFADYFLTIFHTLFIAFVLVGWAHPRTRKVHITALLLTLIAWMLLGLYKGAIGYCPLTDWHWDVKRVLGETGMPASFVEYQLEKVTGIHFSTLLVDVLTAAGLVFGISMAAIVYLMDKRKASQQKKLPA